MIAYLLMNLMISLCLTLFARGCLHRYFKMHPWAFYVFIFLLCFCLPVVGALIGLFMVIAIYHQRTKFHEHVEVLNNPINLLRIKPFYAKYGAGGGTLRLLNQTASPSARTAALFQIAASSLSAMNALLYQLLPDTSDEIRLLAFNILDEQEGRMTQAIQKLQDMLKNEDLTPAAHAQLEKNLAKLYWDLVYDHLIIRELEASMLEKAQAYALSALNVLTHDAMLWALLGRTYVYSKKYHEAEEAFSKAIALNSDPAKVLPYLAEIHFNRQDYVVVQQTLSSTPSLMDITLIAPVKRFWELT